jgi:hypothetical protein
MSKPNVWRVAKPERNREVLTKAFPAAGFHQALAMAECAAEVVTEYGQDGESQLSIGPSYLLVILHGVGKGPVSEVCYQLAEALDKVLADFTLATPGK